MKTKVHCKGLAMNPHPIPNCLKIEFRGGLANYRTQQAAFCLGLRDAAFLKCGGSARQLKTLCFPRFPQYCAKRIGSKQSWGQDVRSFAAQNIQGSPKECFPGLVNLVTAVAYHFCLNLPGGFSQRGKHSLGDPCIF